MITLIRLDDITDFRGSGVPSDAPWRGAVSAWYDRYSTMPDAPTPKDPAMTQHILWAALLMSILSYGAIGQLVPGAAEGPPQVVPFALLGLAAVQTGLALVLPARLPGLQPLARSILGWALAESIAVLGLVLHILGAGRPFFYGLLAWSAVLLVVLRPRTDVEERRVG